MGLTKLKYLVLIVFMIFISACKPFGKDSLITSLLSSATSTNPIINPVVPSVPPSQKWSYLKYSFDKPIKDYIIDGNTAYLTGDFTTYGKNGYGFVFLNDSLTTVKKASTKIYNQSIIASAEDSQGRIYLLGTFNTYDNSIKYLSRILPNGEFDPSFTNMNLSTNGEVTPSLQVVSDTVYVSGDITGLNGVSRTGGLAFNTNTLAVTDWNPKIYKGGQSLKKIDSDRVAIVGGHDRYGNDAAGIFSMNNAGILTSLTPDFSTEAPNFEPVGIIHAGNSQYFAFTNQKKLVKILASGHVDSSFGIVTTEDQFNHNAFVFKNEIYQLLTPGSDGKIRFARYSMQNGARLGVIENLGTIDTQSCQSTYSVPDFLAAPDESQSRIYLSSSCKFLINSNSVNTLRESGLLEFDVTSNQLNVTPFDIADSWTITDLYNDKYKPVIKNMVVYDGVLYLSHFYKGMVAVDIANKNTLFNLDNDKGSDFAVGAQGLFLYRTVFSTNYNTTISSFNHKNGQSVNDILTAGQSSMTYPFKLGRLYLNSNNLYAYAEDNSFNFTEFPSNSRVIVYDLNGQSTEFRVAKDLVVSGCMASSRGFDFSGLCVFGTKQLGTKDKGLYVYNTVTKNIETDLLNKLPDYSKDPIVAEAYFDQDYEAYLIEAAFDFDPNINGSPTTRYARLYIYEKGSQNLLYVFRTSYYYNSRNQSSKYYISRYQDKLIISGLAFIADVSWDSSSNINSCNGTCYPQKGLTAIDLTSGQVVNGYGSSLTVNGTNSVHTYDNKIFVQSNGTLHLCSNNSSGYKTQTRIFNALTGAVIPSAQYPFQTQTASVGCGPILELANNDLFYVNNLAFSYDNQNIGSFISVNLETGQLNDYLLNGTTSGLYKVGQKIFLTVQNVTQGFGKSLTSKVIEFDIDQQTGSDVDLSTFNGLFNSQDIIKITGSRTKLALASINKIAVANIASGSILTSESTYYETSGDVSSILATPDRLFISGNLATMNLKNISDQSIQTTLPVNNLLASFAFDSIEQLKIINQPMTMSAVISFFSATNRLKLIDDDVYFMGIERFDNQPQSLIKLNSTTGDVISGFNIATEYNYMNFIFEGLIFDLIKNKNNQLIVGGFFNMNINSQASLCSGVFDLSSGQSLSTAGVSYPEIVIDNPSNHRMSMGPNDERIIISNESSGYSSLIVD